MVYAANGLVFNVPRENDTIVNFMLIRTEQGVTFSFIDAPEVVDVQSCEEAPNLCTIATATPEPDFTPTETETPTPTPTETETATPTSTTTPAAVSGQVVFESNRDGNSEIYVMNADGTGQTNLTNLREQLLLCFNGGRPQFVHRGQL